MNHLNKVMMISYQWIFKQSKKRLKIGYKFFKKKGKNNLTSYNKTTNNSKSTKINTFKEKIKSKNGSQQKLIKYPQQKETSGKVIIRLRKLSKRIIKL